MIAIRLTVPIACWRRGHAREFWESEPLPPPATCYGALLSFVGEEDPERHLGCRVTAGLMNEPATSVVLRTLWRVKKKALPQGLGANASPGFHQLVVGSDLVIWLASDDELRRNEGLERRVRNAFADPGSIDRFGGWSLGESTHLINDAVLLSSGAPPAPCRAFVIDAPGDVTLPVWVDHVGSEATRYAVGTLATLDVPPAVGRLPAIVRS